MPDELKKTIAALEGALPNPDDAVSLHLSRLKRHARRLGRLPEEIERLRGMLRRTPEILGADGLEPAATVALDGLCAALGARRGFVGLVEGDSWGVVVARDLAEDVDDPESLISRGVLAKALEADEPVVLTDARVGDFAEQESVVLLGLRSVLCLPFRAGSQRGFVYVDNHRVRGAFDDDAVAAVEAWMPLLSSSLSRAASRDSEDAPFARWVTRSTALNERLQELARVARFDASILITGETGTGKGLLARCIHDASARAKGPFVHVNCGALPESLIEAELFGSVKGAFTGAVDRVGKFEAADGGTLFLDELDSMPEPCQVKLLVALQDRVVTPLGANQPVPISVRVIGAMNGLGMGGLREDVYYRLAVFPMLLPPLRERPEDVPLLARTILERTAHRYGLGSMRLSEESLRVLTSHAWPGNVRELENTLDRAVLLARDGVIERLELMTRPPVAPPAASAVAPAAQVPRVPAAAPASPQGTSWVGRRVPKEVFLEAWNAADGVASRVAERLGVKERSVYRMRKRYLDDETDR